MEIINKPWHPGAKNKDIITDLNDQINKRPAVDGISAYPNPTTGYITIKMQSSRQEDVSFVLSDVTGKRSKKTLKYSIIKGKNELNVDLGEFRSEIIPGIYILIVESNSFRKRMRVIIQK